MNLSIPFLSPKNNSNYAQVISIRQLTHDYSNGRYSLIVSECVNQSASGMDVEITTALSSNLVPIFGIRYLVIEDGFVWMSVVHTSLSSPYSSIYDLTGATTVFNTNSNVSLANNPYIFHFIRGYDVQDNGGPS